jgi:hypothetical protein
MTQRSLRRGGRVQHYHVSPVSYTLSAGGDDSTLWGARIAGFLYVAAGTALIAVLLWPSLGFFGTVLMIFLGPVFGVLGLVTVIPSPAEPWVVASFAAMFLAVGLGILRAWRIAHLAGILVAVAVFVPAIWAGPVVGGFLVVVLWRGQKGLPWLSAGERQAAA